MAAANYTPIILYHSTTASAVPTAANLAQGELAININDGKLYYEDSSGVVQVLATKGTGTIGGSNTQVQYNSSGALAGSSNFTFDGTTATINTLNLTTVLDEIYGGTGLNSYTTGDLLYASGANTLAKLSIGTSTYILTSTGSVPQWSAPSSVTVATANNLAGGAAGSVPYQSGASTTTFLSIGTQNQVLTSTGSAPQWSSGLTITTLSTTGNTTLGDAAADNITINGTITSNLIFTDNTYDIGASGATRPRNLYLAGDATIGGSIAATTLDLTNLEVTNIKAKDGTAGMQIADSTGVVSFTANPIMSGGTANGVTYLNGSKVLTTGSALTFDGATLTNTRNTTDGTSAALTLNNSGATGAYATLNLNAGSVTYQQFADAAGNAIGTAGVMFRTTSNHPLVWGVNNSEQMRLTSTGLTVEQGAVFNESGADSDFRVESDTNTHALFVDAGSSRVGVNTSNLYQSFTVNGAIEAATDTSVGGGVSMYASYGGATNDYIALWGSKNSAGGPAMNYGGYWNNSSEFISTYDNFTGSRSSLYLNGSDVVFEAASSDSGATTGTAVPNMTQYMSLGRSGFVFNESGADIDFRVESDTNTHMLFVDAGNNRVGIAQSSPGYELHVGAQQAIGGTAGTIDRFAIQPYSNTGGPYIFKARTVSGASDFLDLYYGSSQIASFGLNQRVGINVDTPLAQLQVYVGTSNSTALQLSGLSSYTAGVGPRLVFQNGRGDLDEQLAGIQGSFDLDSNGNYGRLSFFTRTTDALGIEEKMRIGYRGDITTFPIANGGAVFNENGADADFRVESDTNTHALFVDASQSKVTVNKDATTYDGALSVFGASLATLTQQTSNQHFRMIGKFVNTYLSGGTFTLGTVSSGGNLHYFIKIRAMQVDAVSTGLVESEAYASIRWQGGTFIAATVSQDFTAVKSFGGGVNMWSLSLVSSGASYVLTVTNNATTYRCTSFDVEIVCRDGGDVYWNPTVESNG